MSGKLPKNDGENHGQIKNTIVYIDDLLIHSKTYEDHLSALDKVLQRLTDNNMKINLAKNTELSYFGFRLTPDGITPGKDKLKAVEKTKIPDIEEEIKSFGRIVQYLQDTHGRLC